MSKLEDFLSEADEKEIVEAIQVAESKTSGEIRVHIEQNCESDVYEHALEVFHYLKMDNTAQRNGVLIYIAVENKSFVICGEPKDFWITTFLPFGPNVTLTASANALTPVKIKFLALSEYFNSFADILYSPK